MRKVSDELSEHLKEYEGPAKAFVYNDLALRDVISLVSQYNEHLLKTQQEKPQEKLQEKPQDQLQAKVPKYQFINWMGPTFPDTVTKHPFWAFHQALAQSQSTEKDFNKKKQWALASIKSLIEIDINRQFVIEAGLAYERDLDNEIYRVDPLNPGIFIKQAGEAEFDAFRTATGSNARFGDDGKADTLRTSEMIVEPPARTDFVSYHPSISYPTGDLLLEKRRAAKEKQIDDFYKGLLLIWSRIDALQNPADKQKCLNTFCSHVNSDKIGCANERLQGAIDRVTETLNQYEDNVKELSEKNFTELVQKVSASFNAPNGNPNLLFEDLVKQYSGYTVTGTLKGKPWTMVIGVDTKEQFAEKIIDTYADWMALDNKLTLRTKPC